MRKIVSVILLLCIVCNVMFLSVSAEETDTANREVRSGEEVVALACIIWPEYADRLTAERKPMARGRAVSSSDCVVISETVKLSDNETMQYVEYASGFAVAALGSWTIESTHYGSNHKYVIGSLTVASGSFVSYLMDFEYTLDYSSVDYINSKGQYVNSNTRVYEHGFEKYETTAGSPAFLTYQVYFEDSLGNYYGSAIANLTVGNDKFNYNVA